MRQTSCLLYCLLNPVFTCSTGPRESFLCLYCVVVLICREQLAESILHEGSTGCRVVEKFLKILQVVVQEPGQVFKPFLPSIIALCMEQVYPIIAEVGQTQLAWESVGVPGIKPKAWCMGSICLDIEQDPSI